MRPSHPRSGFSLIELLVVTAIVVVLAGLLFPAMGIARRQAKTILCQNNLRQIASAIDIYAAEWEGLFPQLGEPSPAWHWSKYFGAYLGYDKDPNDGNFIRVSRVLACPGMVGDPPAWKAGYQINEEVVNLRGWLARKSYFSFGHRSETNLFLCQTGANYFHDRWSFRLGSFGTWHAGGTGIAFMDGHVETRVIGAIAGDPNGYRQGWNTVFMLPQ